MKTMLNQEKSKKDAKNEAEMQKKQLINKLVMLIFVLLVLEAVKYFFGEKIASMFKE